MHTVEHNTLEKTQSEKKLPPKDLINVYFTEWTVPLDVHKSRSDQIRSEAVYSPKITTDVSS